MNRPAATALAQYGRDLDVAKLTRALAAVDDEIERLQKACGLTHPSTTPAPPNAKAAADRMNPPPPE